MSDSFTTSELITATQQVFKFNPLFLKLFFRETYTFTSEEVFLDKIPGKVNMAVYCAPTITGKVDRTRGYSTNHFKPGYTKPKHTINPNMSIKRAAGEQIGQPETPVERRAKIIMQNLLDEELSISQLEEFQDAVPGQDLAEGVRTRDEEQVDVLAVVAVQVAQGVQGVGRAGSVDVHPAHGEPRVGCRRDHRHQIAMLALCHLVLLPRQTRRHEDDLIEVEPLAHLTRRDEVTVMDGVEGATHHAHAVAQWWPPPLVP